MSRLLSRSFVAAAVAAVATAGGARAAIITNGTVVANISDANGAIGSVAFGGTEFYNAGTPVSDFGLQLGANTATFARNINPNNFTLEQIPVTVTSTATTVTATGTYTAGGASVQLTRVYDLVPGLNVLRTTTTFTNLGTTAVADLRYFESFDPDQALASLGTFNTFNDVLSLGGLTAAQAASTAGAGGLTVVAGPGLAGFLGLGDLDISSGAELNAFVANPLDPNGASADIGFASVFSINLAVGGTATTAFFQAFGVTAAAAQADFIAATTPTAAIPEPASMTLAAVGMAGLVGVRIRRRKAEAAA